MKQHQNISRFWIFLKSFYRKPKDLYCMYDHLAKSSMSEWFYPNHDIKDIYKRCIKFGTYFTKSAQYYLILVTHSLIKDEIVSILKNK